MLSDFPVGQPCSFQLNVYLIKPHQVAIKKISDQEFIEEFLLNDSRAQKKVQRFYKGMEDNLTMALVKEGATRTQALSTIQDAMVVLFHHLRDERFRKGSIQEYTLKLCLGIYRNTLPNKEYSHLNEEKAMEKLYARLDPACREILRSHYFENKDKEDILKKYGLQTVEEKEARRFNCLKNIKDLLLKDEALLQEIKELAN